MPAWAPGQSPGAPQPRQRWEVPAGSRGSRKRLHSHCRGVVLWGCWGVPAARWNFELVGSPGVGQESSPSLGANPAAEPTQIWPLGKKMSSSPSLHHYFGFCSFLFFFIF